MMVLQFLTFETPGEWRRRREFEELSPNERESNTCESLMSFKTVLPISNVFKVTFVISTLMNCNFVNWRTKCLVKRNFRSFRFVWSTWISWTTDILNSSSCFEVTWYVREFFNWLQIKCNWTSIPYHEYSCWVYKRPKFK